MSENNHMRILFLFIFQFIVLLAFAQYDSLVTHITIGKMKNIFFSRGISQEHLGKIRLSYAPIWYSTNMQSKYRLIGFKGQRLAPYLNSVPSAAIFFNQYKKQKRWSRLCIPIAYVSYGTWAVVGLTEYYKKMNNPFFSIRSFPFLMGFFYFTYRGVQINARADISLLMSVRAFNQHADLGK